GELVVVEVELYEQILAARVRGLRAQVRDVLVTNRPLHDEVGDQRVRIGDGRRDRPRGLLVPGRIDLDRAVVGGRVQDLRHAELLRMERERNQATGGDQYD